jgi:hypothetical protein
MRSHQAVPAADSDPVDAARDAIWRLFNEGYVDEDMATAGLLAVDLGTRRTGKVGRHVATAQPDEPPSRDGRHAA